jgi:NAD(P)-dependent dehydrogenase (short-subunit alcohol dehydrogenase family)
MDLGLAGKVAVVTGASKGIGLAVTRALVRSPSVLNKPLAEELALGKKITQRALRRTFNDLARAAHVSDLVTRSISGHLTERMQHHYSTVNAAEQREALAKVIRFFNPNTAQPRAVRSGEESGEGTPQVGRKRKRPVERRSKPARIT